jgi:hypothetical protein
MTVDAQRRVRKIPIGSPCLVQDPAARPFTATMGSHLGRSSFCHVIGAEGQTLLVAKRWVSQA